MPNSQKFFKYFQSSKKIFTSHKLGKSLSGQRIGLTLGLAGAIAFSHHSVTLAQTAITGLNGGYQPGQRSSYSTTTASPCQSPYSPCNEPITLEFGVGATNDYRITGFNANAGSYSLVNLADEIKFQRKDGPGATGKRQLMLFERTSNSTQMRSSYTNNMETALLNDIANRGIDNAFSNDNSVASNNLERIDYIIGSGIDVPTDVRGNIGFLILERGGNDPFKIAAITSLDANGNPASFAPLKNVAAGTWGRVGPSIITSVMRREENEPNFRPSHTVDPQIISGIYISLSDLNIPAGQKVYGYALFPSDIDANKDLINLTDFPTNTSGASGQGGLDLMAGGGIYLANSLHVVSGTLYKDTNGDKAFNNGEATLPNGIEVILYRDTNGNGAYDSGVDEKVQTNSTSRGNGGYNFIGVADGTYRVFVDTKDPDVPSNLVLGTPNNTQVVVSGSNRTGINFGFNPPTDYGDAPVSYDDTADNNPARHAIASNLYLGSIAPDAEARPQSSTNADGDDNATSPNVDDEDAFTSLPNVIATRNYSLNVPVTNTSGGNATLHGWIDFNKNGKFELGEYKSAVVTNTSPVNLTWAVPAGTTAGNSYARFRLTSDTSLTDNGSTNNIDERSIGNANNGEVEDYPVAIATLVTVSGTVYEDFGGGGDNNNTFDSGEGTIGNVTVNLFQDNNNDNQPDGAAVQTAQTDASTGAYQFTNVAPGRYLIQVDTRDTDIPSTHAIGTPNPIQINISNTNLTNRDFGFNTVSKTCPPGSFLSEQTFLNFQNPVAEPGTTQGNYGVGAVYRFPNVATDIDALVRIKSLNDATLTQIDINNSGVPSAFQPQVRANSTNTGKYSVDFDISFVQSGTNRPVELRKVLATGIDIDGDSGRVREASELGGNQFTTYAIDNNSRLTATELSPERVKFESTTSFNLADITINPLNQGSAYYENNTQSIEYRAGLIIDSGTNNPANQRLTSLLFDCVSYDLAVISDPNLLLVKRITAINPGQSEEVRFNSFIDDPNTSDDNAQNWPNNDNIYLPGRISVADVEPGDEVEYTIYFLSFGGKPATNVKICDVVPDNMSFVADSNNSNSGIAFLNSSAAGATPTNLSNAADTDEGTFYAPNTPPPTVGNPPTNLCQKVDSTGNMVSVGAAKNINGAIVVEIDSLPEAREPGIPENSYGFIRFRAKVQ